MYAFAHSLIPGPRVAVNRLEEFAQALTMLHGMSAIVQSAPALLEDTPFKVGLLPAPSDPAMPLSPGTEGYLAAVEAARSRMTWLGGQEEAGGYSFMIAILRYTLLLQRDQPGRQMAAVPFAVLLPGPVLSGIREQQPLALCLVAGYATVLHALRTLDTGVGKAGDGRGGKEVGWQRVGGGDCLASAGGVE